MRVWPLAVALLALSGCFRKPPPSPIATLPNIVVADPWRPAQPRSGIHVTVAVPATVMAKAAVIQATVTIANSTSTPAAFTVPTPCRIANWEIVDAKDKAVAATRPVLCAQVVRTLTLKPGEQVARTILLGLDPGVLKSGQRYRVLFDFWGEPGETTFRAE